MFFKAEESTILRITKYDLCCRIWIRCLSLGDGSNHLLLHGPVLLLLGRGRNACAV